MITVEPITSRQAGELARLLEERGIGKQDFQKLIEYPQRVVELLTHDFIMNRRQIPIDLTTSLYDIEDDPDSWLFIVGSKENGYPSRLTSVGRLFSAVRNALDQEGRLTFSRDPNIADLLSLSESSLMQQRGVGENMVCRLQRWLESNNLPRLKRI